MQHWLAATADGACLGLLLYACVRVRMYFGPKAKLRYGATARRFVWLACILLMILLANLGLRLLRYYLDGFDATANNLLLEIWFAILALAIPLTLIFKRMNRKR